jgi:DNA helicase-2/ATP-dependent DNA helicase PcrA
MKNQMTSPEEYLKHIATTPADKKVAEIYIEYNKRLFENNAMDFDDLLLKPIELFNNNEKFFKK